MKQVELTEIRAILREVVAASGNNEDDVRAIMAIGALDGTSTLSDTSIPEVNDLLRVLERALPSLDEGRISLQESAWLKFADLYYRRVMSPVFA